MDVVCFWPTNNSASATPLRFQANGKPTATMLYFPLSKQLSTLVANKKMRDLLLYRSEIEAEDGVYKDVFDGSAYKGLTPDLFENDLDIALSIFVEGSNPFKGGEVKMTIVNIIVLNLPPLER